MRIQAAKAEDFDQLKQLDKFCFRGCGDEFTANRRWWIAKNARGRIIAYAGAAYSEGVCIFVRAWVDNKFRRNGLHRKLIDARMRHAAKVGCYRAVTYTLKSNTPSANNLLRRGFLLYNPSYAWAGNEQLYFYKDI